MINIIGLLMGYNKVAFYGNIVVAWTDGDLPKDTAIFVGQLRTQLGIKGRETEGPQLAAKALFKSIKENK